MAAQSKSPTRVPQARVVTPRVRDGSTGRSSANLRAASAAGVRGVFEGHPWTAHPDLTARADDFGSGRKRILVGFSPSPTADAALELAANWCRAFSATACVLYVRPWDPLPGGGRIFLDTLDEAQQLVEGAVVQMRQRGAPATALVCAAHRMRVGATIVSQARLLHVDFILLGTHARGAAISALCGSTSLTVARRASQPVILVKTPGRKKSTWVPRHLMPPTA